MSDGSVPAKVAAALERISQALRVLDQRAAYEHGLSPIQLRVLLRLAAGPAGVRGPGALAREFDVSAPSLSGSLDALERKGLVRRRRRGRAIALALTPAGRALAARLAAVAAPLERSVAALDEPEQVALMRSLYALIQGLQREGAVTVARMCVTCQHFRPDAHPRAAASHHCALMDVPLAERDLRVDCPDHERAA